MTRLLIVPLLVLPLVSACLDEGLSTIETDVVETHYQGGGAIDVLFVVDTSGSMSEEQEALGRGFDAFIDSFIALETDFHIGITNMDYEDNAGALLGTPTYLTPESAELVTRFANNARLGTGGSATEKGLEAARQALGPAKTDNENAGFLREPAVLAIIFVSDEDDQSTADNQTYLDFFLELKRGDRRRLSVSAIAGDVPDGCPTAEAGTRYADLAAATGGGFTSICAGDLGMPTLGPLVSGFQRDFRLAHLPEEGSVAVAVDGEEILPDPTTWELVGDEVRFADDAVPPDCAEVLIAYRTREAVDDPAPVFETSAAVCATPSSTLLVPANGGGCAQAPLGTLWALLALLGLPRLRRARRG